MINAIEEREVEVLILTKMGAERGGILDDLYGMEEG